MSDPHFPARKDSHQARDYYERALQELDQDAPPPAVGALLLRIARDHAAAGGVTAAGDSIEAVLALPDYGDMDAVRAEALELRGRLACEAGRLDDAEHDFLAQQEHARRAGLTPLVALGDEHLASLALVRGNAAEGAERLEQASASYDGAGDAGGAIRALQQLAQLHVDYKRWNAAEHAIGTAVSRAQGAGDHHAVAVLELLRAQMSIDRGNIERARASTERALDLARRAEDPALLARAVAMSGVVAREFGELERAGRCFDDAQRHAESLDDTLILGEIACERAELLARRGEHDGTLHNLNRAYRALARLQARPGTAELSRRLRRLEAGFLDVARRWGQRIESQDHDTSGHVDRVADLTCEIARRLGAEPASLFWYRVGAYLHDLGKLAVPAAVLNKQGRLTPDEWALVKRHPVAGADMLAEADFPWDVRPIVESHHECWDGTGYPHGLAGEEIPLAARIFCVADVYDALVSRRPFKQVLSRDEAVEAMRNDVGRQFDPAVFRVFEDVVREGIAIPGITSAVPLPEPPAPDAPMVDDPLTSVADLPSWRRRAAALMAGRRGTDRPVALLLADLDDFARVNAAYGRLQGDDVLWAVAKVLQRGLRSGDLIGRRSSDEFVVLLPDTPPELALEIAERLREAVSTLRCARRDGDGQTITVSACVGVAASPADGETIESLLAAADRALFRARSQGRNLVAVADSGELAPARGALDFSPFIDREDELRVLVAQLDLAARGEPRFVSVGGELGIGKSALVRQLEPEVHLRSGWMVYGHGNGAGGRGPYAPWIDVISRLHELGGVEARPWRGLHALIPNLSTQDTEKATPAPDILQQEIVGVLRRASRARPIVVVLEDMHHADTASWATLDALLTGVDDERLLVCYTLRPDEAQAAAEWRRRLSRHPRSVHVQLRRFGLDEVRRWIQTVFHDAAPGDDVARFVHEYSEGIPSLVLHVLRASCEDGSIWYGGTRWEWRPIEGPALPAGIGYVMERRLERLSPATRTLLASAAVLGGSLSVELLVAVTGTPDTEVRAALEEGITASVLKPSDEADGAFTFRHPMLADICIRGVPERQRQRIHDVAARMLELRMPSRVADIAAHYHAAGNDASAYAFAQRVAERSLAAFAHDSAVEAFQVAQRYAPSSRDLADLRVRFAETASLAGRYAHAESLVDLALEWLERQPPAGATYRARRLREWLELHRGKPTTRTAESLRALLAEVETQGPAGEVPAVAIAAAECALLRADWPEAAALARRGLDAADGEGPAGRLHATALLLVGAAELAESPALGTSRVRQALQRFVELGDAWGEVRAMHILGDALARQTPGDAADDTLTAALERARDIHNAPVAAGVSRSLGELRARQGRFDEAHQWFGDAERLSTTMEDEPQRVRTLLSGAVALRDAGDRANAKVRFDHAARRARELDIPWIELVAHAGAASLNGGPESDMTKARWARTSELVSDARPDWWFPGREHVDAFAIRMALTGGHTSVAHDLFIRASRRLETLDPYGSAWLAAECGRELERAGLRTAIAAREAALERATSFGFARLAAALAER
jgi:diguanylate cyclase (GGDEF)-like protein/putative nucleotidyltransferase with HDIG domain